MLIILSTLLNVIEGPRPPGSDLENDSDLSTHHALQADENSFIQDETGEPAAGEAGVHFKIKKSNIILF